MRLFIYSKRKEKFTTVTHKFDKEGSQKTEKKQQKMWTKRIFQNKHHTIFLWISLKVITSLTIYLMGYHNCWNLRR